MIFVVIQRFAKIEQSLFKGARDMLKHRCGKCINIKGAYTENDGKIFPILLLGTKRSTLVYMLRQQTNMFINPMKEWD